MIFVKMVEKPSGTTITKNQQKVSVMFFLYFTICVSSKSGSGDNIFPSSNLEFGEVVSCVIRIILSTLFHNPTQQ